MATNTNYLIPVGKDDEARMGSINLTFDPYSLKWSVPESVIQKLHYLDVGCGPGVLTSKIARNLGANGAIVAIDRSAEQIEVARKNALNNAVDNVEWKVGDIYDLSAYKEQFDIVHCRFVLSHLKQPLDAIKQLSSALKPGGLLVMEEMTGNAYTWTPNETFSLKVWRWMVNLQHFLQRSDIGVGARLAKIIEEQGFHYVEEAKPSPTASTPETKALFPLAVRALALKLPRLFTYLLTPWINDLARVQNDCAYSVKFHTFIQIRGVKPLASIT